MAKRVQLVLLPGLVCDARLWHRVARSVAGVAEATVGDLTRHDTMAALAADVIERAPPRFALAGLSMGGYCALEIVRQAPERVAALALIDTSARPDTPESRANRERQIERARSDYAGVIEELLPKWLHRSRVLDPEVAGVVRTMALEAGAAQFERQQRAIMSRLDSRPHLGFVGCPTLVLCGRDDAVTPVEVHEEMARGMTKATLKILDDCGHLSPLEQPEAVAFALRDWIGALR
jgi:pimeloyl-ACP methyl ester carboxylesterase